MVDKARATNVLARLLLTDLNNSGCYPVWTITLSAIGESHVYTSNSVLCNFKGVLV